MTLVTRDPVTGLRHGPIRFPDGQPPVPSGCRWCGMSERTHRMGIRSIPSRGVHDWEQPTNAQILARMRARSLARYRASIAAFLERYRPDPPSLETLFTLTAGERMGETFAALIRGTTEPTEEQL